MFFEALNFNPIFLVGPFALFLIFIESYFRKKHKKSSFNYLETITNINCGIFAQGWRIVIYLALLPIYEFCYQYLAILNIELNVYSFILGFILFDFIYYVMHWFSHNSSFLWMGHVVHHQSNSFNFSVALRHGMLTPILTFPFFLPMAIMGFDIKSFFIISSLNAAIQFLGHTEYLNNLGFLDKLFMTPKNHRVHHSSEEVNQNRNFGGVLLVWDYIFKTLADPTTRVNKYGLSISFESVDVFKANFQPVADFFKSPESAVKVNKMETDSISRPWKQYYYFFQFFLLFNFALFFLFTNQEYHIYYKVIFILLISLGIYTMTLVLENKKFGLFLDIVRLCISIPIVIFLL